MLDENKFNELKKEYKNILEKLASPELISDFRKLEELSKKESHIKKIIEKNEELIGAKKNISENENINNYIQFYILFNTLCQQLTTI